MSLAKKDTLNEILLGKIQSLPRYDFENSCKVVEQAMKELLFLSHISKNIVNYKLK